MADIGRIRAAYAPRWDAATRQLFIRPPGAADEVAIAFRPPRRVVLTFGDPAVAARVKGLKSDDEVRAAGAEAFDARELYRLLLSDEEFAEARRGRELDDRTAAYLAATRKGIGLVDRKDEDCGGGERLEAPESMAIGAASPAEVGRLPDGRWAVQWSARYEIDAFNTTTLYFDHRPTRPQVEKAILVDAVETHLARRRGYDPTFRCWECGRAGIHWLDIDVEGGGLAEKFERFREKYCGC